LIQEGFRSFVGSGHELIGELHGRVSAGKFVAVDAVCHDRRCRMALEEFFSRPGVWEFSRVGEFCVAGFDLLQALVVFGACNDQVNQRSTLVGLANGIHCDAVRRSRQHLEITHQRIVSNSLLTHLMPDDGRGRGDLWVDRRWIHKGNEGRLTFFNLFRADGGTRTQQKKNKSHNPHRGC